MYILYKKKIFSVRKLLKILKPAFVCNIPAKTGNDNNNNTAVTTTAHPNKANLCNLIPGLLIFSIVVMTHLTKFYLFVLA
jgi:hypothetical protein